MGKIYCKIDMEKVKKIISQKGFYYICTKVLYPDFVGPEYIIVSDDPDITVKHPKANGMILVSVEKFTSMAEAYNRYYKNDVKHLTYIPSRCFQVLRERSLNCYCSNKWR